MSETTAERGRACAPTLDDVARSAGVSLTTASRMLTAVVLRDSTPPVSA